MGYSLRLALCVLCALPPGCKREAAKTAPPTASPAPSTSPTAPSPPKVAPAPPTPPAPSAAPSPIEPAPAQGGLPPKASAVIGQSGGRIDLPGARLTLPANAVSGAAVSVELEPTPATLPALPDARPKFRDALAGRVKMLRVYRAGPSGTRFARPGTLTLKLAPSELPPGASLADLHALSFEGSAIEDLTIVSRAGDEVTVEVPHFSMLGLALVTGALVAAGTLAILMRGTSDPIMRRDCASFLDDKNERVRQLAADPSKFSVDTERGDVRLDLGRPIKGKNVSQLLHARRVGQVLDNPEGDCVNMSTLYGSMLLAKGYPVRLVAGAATYDVVRGGKHQKYSGFHQWAETVIDGRPYYVDTFNPGETKLIPLDDASSKLKLERNRMCGKDPDGKTTGPAPYDDTWFASALTQDDDEGGTKPDKGGKAGSKPASRSGSNNKDVLEATLARLKAKHKRLNAACIAGSNASCSERRETYLEAMKVKKKLDALK